MSFIMNLTVKYYSRFYVIRNTRKVQLGKIYIMNRLFLNLPGSLEICHKVLIVFVSHMC